MQVVKRDILIEPLPKNRKQNLHKIKSKNKTKLLIIGLLSALYFLYLKFYR